ncbi:MAG TPA: hypothetical protein PLH43_01875 [Acetivibrio sp.]|uniref:hypothetical protein n=1 Tax=Acetivibrio sp. TaxID=1872092 RepID=UPI002D15F604|nr:hypothetical protein [Acetivibrio sp.]HOM01563.1 hypothetical protein [Acetivibrio sp.]
MNFVLTLCLGILIGLLIGIVAGIIGAIAGLRVLHLVKTKKNQNKKSAKNNIAYRDINLLHSKFKDVV